MAYHGEDCYFYFYSTCTKGASCPFRHCEAALGSETVCALWLEGRCFGGQCGLRHMEIGKKRSEIPCYRENHPSGCQKLHCALHCDWERHIGSLFLPPSEATPPPAPAREGTKAAPAPTPAPALAPAQASALLAVPQTQFPTQPNLPATLQSGPSGKGGADRCPKHPRVIVRTADINSNDDDLSFEKSDEAEASTPRSTPGVQYGSQGVSAQKLGVDAQQGPANTPLPSQASSSPKQKSVRTVVRTVVCSSKEREGLLVRLDLPDRLRKRKFAAGGGSDPPLKQSLAEWLGSRVEVPETNINVAPKKVQIPRSLKERLGPTPQPSCDETTVRGDKVGEIHVKTLEQIRLERAAQNLRKLQTQLQMTNPSKANESTSTTSSSSTIQIKTLSEILAEKKYHQQETERQKYKKDATNIKTKIAGEMKKTIIFSPTTVSKGRSEEPAGSGKGLQGVHVKTLQEIKLEKALRSQQSPGSRTSSQPQREATAGNRQLFQVPKGPSIKEEKLQEGSAITSQSRVIRIKTTESSHEPRRLDNTLLVQRCETVQENHTQQPQEKRTSQKETSAWTPPPGDTASCKSRVVEKPVLTAAPDVGGVLSSPLPTESCQKIEVPTSEPGDSTVSMKCAAKSLGENRKAKPKVNVKQSGVKVSSPLLAPKHKAPKRKTSEMYPDIVKPLGSTKALQPSPAKKAAVTVSPVLHKDKPVTAPAGEKPPDGFVLPPSQRAPHLSPLEEPGSSTSQTAASTWQASSASTAEPLLSTEDDFEKLVSEFSENIEAEIDLCPEKDEDQLLLELTELINS